MMFLVFFLLIAGITFFLVRRTMRANDADNWQNDSWFSGGRESFRAKRPEPPKPIKTFYFEGNQCEVCSSRSAVQFKHPVSGSVFEFCGHHARKNEKGLKESGHKVTIDTRDFNGAWTHG